MPASMVCLDFRAEALPIPRLGLRERRVLDDQRIVGLRANCRGGPLGAAKQDRLRRVSGVE